MDLDPWENGDELDIGFGAELSYLGLHLCIEFAPKTQAP
jgi:hypothetical protein